MLTTHPNPQGLKQQRLIPLSYYMSTGSAGSQAHHGHLGPMPTESRVLWHHHLTLRVQGKKSALSCSCLEGELHFIAPILWAAPTFQGRRKCSTVLSTPEGRGNWKYWAALTPTTTSHHFGLPNFVALSCCYLLCLMVLWLYTFLLFCCHLSIALRRSWDKHHCKLHSAPLKVVNTVHYTMCCYYLSLWSYHDRSLLRMTLLPKKRLGRLWALTEMVISWQYFSRMGLGGSFSNMYLEKTKSLLEAKHK